MHSEWFNAARYGMFIHFGAYSQAARSEWIMNRELIPPAEYQEKYIENFHAEKFDPADIAAKAKRWGMGYIVLTTRHHDGFAMWDSKVNPWNAKNLGPKRDIVADYVKAVREAGLKVGLYYSPANWSHPDYPGAFYRDWPGEKDWKDEASRKRFIAYYRAELEELMTKYGKIDYLWFDGCIPENIDGAETLKMLRAWQPGMLVNNRLAEPYDVKVCEQTVNPPKLDVDWEACMTLNNNWGWHAGDVRWKTPLDVIDILLNCASQGGNLLLNVGPKGDGTIPDESIRILDAAGAWLAKNREAVSNSEKHPFSWNCTARPITRKGNKIYLHFLNNPFDQFCWGELKNKVLSAKYLDNGEAVAFRQDGPRLFLSGLHQGEEPRTVVLEVEGTPEALMSQTTFWIPE